ALRRSDGTICFIDFEYAGWDDVAKTVCDFFLQPAVPVPWSYFSEFRSIALQDFADVGLHEQRIDILLPVHQVKWCCILLNDFLSVAGLRRTFALGTEEIAQRKTRQLELAVRSLRKIDLAKEAIACT